MDFVPRKTYCSAESSDQIGQAFLVSRILRIELLQRSLKPERGEDGRCTVARAYYEQHIDVTLPNHVVDVGVNQGQGRASAPMSFDL